MAPKRAKKSTEEKKKETKSKKITKPTIDVRLVLHGETINWEDFKDAARINLSFLDLCRIHPKLDDYYNNCGEEEVSRIEDRESALILFMDFSTENFGLRAKVLESWFKKGLLEKKTVFGYSIGRQESAEEGTSVHLYHPQRDTDSHLLKDKISSHRHTALIDREKRESEKHKAYTENEKTMIGKRRKAGLQRDFRDSEKLRGTITHIDLERRQGEVYVSERNCATSFSLDCVDYGLKEIRIRDEVFCVITRRSALEQAKGARVREQATGVRPAIQRTMSESDIVTFVEQCRTTEPNRCHKILSRVMESYEDFNQLCKTLQEFPEKLGPTIRSVSWLDVVMGLVELSAFPGLQEPRYRHIVTKFYQMLPETPFPYLVKDAIRFISDAGDVTRSADLAVFVECLRMFCHRTGSRHDLPDQFFFDTVELMMRSIEVASGSGKIVSPDIADGIRTSCERIKRGPEERMLFPSRMCFLKSPDSTEHPMHSEQLSDTTKLPWNSVNEYIGCHYNLLKADCFAKVVSSMMWRLGFDGYTVHESRTKDLEFSTSLYENVTVVGESLGDRGVWVCVKFSKPDNFVPMKALDKGALVCLAVSTKKDMVPLMWWATVAFTDLKMINQGYTVLEVIQGDPEMLISYLRANEAYGCSHLSMMFETKLFFFAVKPVLEALDHLRRMPKIPFNNTLLKGKEHGSDEVKSLPGYVPESYREAFFNIVRKMLHAYTFEPGQEKALRWLPHRPILIVQGPPGTGKSFIGCRLVECIAQFRIRLSSGELKNEFNPPGRLLEGNVKKEELPGPILVLTYKNHSLDEFLIDCLDSGLWCGSLRDPNNCACKTDGPSKYCCKNCCDRQGHHKRLVRVGARSQSDRLMKYNLAQLTKPRIEHKHKIRTLRTEAEKIALDLSKLDTGDCDETMVRGFMSSSQLDVLTQEGKIPPEEAWKDWLKDSGPLFNCNKEIASLLGQGSDYHKLGTDPDSIDDVFNLERQFTESLRKQFIEEEKAKATNTEVSDANIAMQFRGKEVDSLDNDFIGSLRSRKAFYQSFCSFPPTPSCRVEAEEDDRLLGQSIEADVPSGAEVPKELRTGRLLPPLFADVDDLWSLDAQQKHELATYWISNHRRFLADRYKACKKEFEGMLAVDQTEFDEARLKALQDADIIGLTTTGAAMNQGILRSLKPSVLMVEEAAEILEGQILSCFVDSIKQVILIGDHKQLRPQVDDQDYADKNNLNISLFQRLIETCKVPYCHLTEQRRMTKRVADLVRPIYSNLTDFHTLKTRTMSWGGGEVKKIPGLANQVMFWSHNHPEEPAKIGLSVMNAKEVEMVKFLVRVLVCKEGLSPDQLTVLSPYMGQARVLKEEMGKIGMERVNCLTVDRFQGDENDIVIVSLVRTERLTSFIRLENRMCVACSRARFGFFMVGSPALLEQVEHWKRTLEIIKEQSPLAVSNTLTLQRPGSDPARYITVSSEDKHFPDLKNDSVWSAKRTDGYKEKHSDVYAD